MNELLTRREFGAVTAAGLATAASTNLFATQQTKSFELDYTLASCMYGYEKLNRLLPEAAKIGARKIDIWPKAHGDQREQLDEIGEEKFLSLLDQHNVTLGCISQYKLGPLGLSDEIEVASRLQCPMIIAAGAGPRGLSGVELKLAVKAFVEKMKPHADKAEEHGVTISIENHGNNLIESPDSMKWLAEFRPSPALSVAFAPYHLKQNPAFQAQLIRNLGDAITMFYAWEYGAGCKRKLPKSEELLQLPGRGSFDFRPLIQALKDIGYSGQTEIFMHPVPRGLPVLATTDQSTKEINRSRAYLDALCQEMN